MNKKKKEKLHKYIFRLQKEVDELTEWLNCFPGDSDDFNYYDGRNDLAIEVLHRLKNIVL